MESFEDGPNVKVHQLNKNMVGKNTRYEDMKPGPLGSRALMLCWITG